MMAGLTASQISSMPHPWRGEMLALFLCLLCLAALAVALALWNRQQRRALADGEDLVARMHAELVAASRIRLLGELSASVVHEVNQPLSSVVTNGEACLRWLDRETPDFAMVRSSVERMIASGRRASKVVTGLRAIACRGEMETEGVDLNALIGDVLALTRYELLRHRIAVRLDLAEGHVAIEGNRAALHQVVANLAMNAVQALSGVDSRERCLTIRTGRSADAGHVWLEIADNGPGFGTDEVQRLFEPFYSTKAAGMGMGLSICRSIVASHSGTIAARANPAGEGASFIISLPVQPATETLP